MSNLEMKVEALTRCVDPAVFARAMQEVSAGPATAPKKKPQQPETDVSREVRKLMTELGLPPHIKGHRYAVTAIRLAVENNNILDAITKELYPAVANVYGTTSSRVERAIRHGVECVWDRGEWETLLQYFGNIVSRTKTQFVESSVNSLFRIARFRLFREQANGGMEERCDVVVNGVPYSSLNDGMKVNVGIDIINTLSRHYKVLVPLFVDKAESVTEMEGFCGQRVLLEVSKSDKELRFVNEG